MAKGYMNKRPRNLPRGAPRDAIKVDFANRLQKAMHAKGWNQSELARRASAYLAKGDIGRDMISHYIRGVSIPRSAQMVAISKALGCSVDHLLPSAPSATDKTPAMDMRQLEDGNVWLRINQATDLETGLKILVLLKKQ